MRYMGGKFKIAKYLSEVLNPCIEDSFYEPFVGGFNLSPRIIAKKHICGDAHTGLINMYKAFQNGWEPPESVSEEEYQAAKNLPDESALKAFIGFGCSFGGKWFGGYGRGGKGADAGTARRSLVKNREKISACVFNQGAYQATCAGVRGSVVYCDPPYANTTKYKGFDFDSSVFWEWCQKTARHNRVFVSEYACPVRHVVRWEKERDCSMNDNRAKVTERLFEVIPA